jgi:hypothetical protein
MAKSDVESQPEKIACAGAVDELHVVERALNIDIPRPGEFPPDNLQDRRCLDRSGGKAERSGAENHGKHQRSELNQQLIPQQKTTAHSGPLS